MSDNTNYTGLEVAIIGMAGKFPGADTIQEFWSNLENGIESITHLTDEDLMASGLSEETIKNPKYVKSAFLLNDIEKFDASFFGLTPREAETMDPQLRIFLECTWAALEDSGYDPYTYANRIGLFSSSGMSTYLLRNIMSAFDLRNSHQIRQIWLGNDPNYIATYTSYKYNLRGPSFNIQTACSSSLVATHLACQSLIDYQCDMVVVGGVKVNVPHKEGYMFQEGEVLSPDGHCKPFDANGKGTLSSNGAGVVILKRLKEAIEDNDHIYAIIKGSSINNDGSNKVGYSAPSVEGQAEAIAEAQAFSEVNAATITYIETHGTATELGDPIEIAALTKAFRSAGATENQYCAIGSVKSNIGHLDSAAGVTGLIKAALSLKNKKIVPSLNYTSPNPKIDFENSPFFVNTKLTDWKNDHAPLRAGVSSFGIGGTNAHAILEEYPTTKAQDPQTNGSLILLSAKTLPSLKALTAKYIAFLKNTDETTANIAFTSQVGRAQFYYRTSVAADKNETAVARLEDILNVNSFDFVNEELKKDVVFLFPGQGAQYLNMAKQTYESEIEFRNTIDYCFSKIDQKTGIQLHKIIFSSEETETLENQINQTIITQPLLFSIEYALAKLWMSWGIEPKAMIGHSLGEYVAACIAGVISLDDALHLICTRGKLIQALPKGNMLSVLVSENEILPLLTENISIAAINAPGMCVVSGNPDEIKQFEQILQSKSIAFQQLHTSHAFHSNMMNPILDVFAEEVKKVKLSAPTIPYISNLTGDWINPNDVTTPEYWVKHLRNCVRFSDGIQKVLENESAIFIEVGPGRVLSTLTKQNSSKPNQLIFNSLPGAKDKKQDYTHLLSIAGKLWQLGIAVNWNAFNKNKNCSRVSMPTYAFIKNKYWIEESKNSLLKVENTDSQNTNNVFDNQNTVSLHSIQNYHQRPILSVDYVAPENDFEIIIATIWQDLIGIEKIGINDNFYELGGHSLLATQMIARFKEAFSIELTLNKFMEAQTVAEMSKIIMEELSSQIGEENLSLMLDEIE